MFITLYVPQHYSRLTCIVFVGNYSICCDRSVITLYIMFILLTSKAAKQGIVFGPDRPCVSVYICTITETNY